MASNGTIEASRPSTDLLNNHSPPTDDGDTCRAAAAAVRDRTAARARMRAVSPHSPEREDGEEHRDEEEEHEEEREVVGRRLVCMHLLQLHLSN